jgi:periplasmic protein CpxP/Spy
MDRFKGQFRPVVGRIFTVACTCLLLATLPAGALAATSDAHEDRAEARIAKMHTQLKISDAQEPAWTKVADAMRDDARKMDVLSQARSEHSGKLSAVDDLKSYAEISDAHAEGIHHLTDAFTPLYASMSDTQKHDADLLFRHGSRMSGGRDAMGGKGMKGGHDAMHGSSP